MQMVDNKFLYFKTFLRHARQPLKDYPFLQDEEIIDLLEYDYLSFDRNIFKVSLQYLKNVKVMPCCICICKPETTKIDQFLKFLLEHTINLEKMVIVPKHKGCNSCSTNISQLMKCCYFFQELLLVQLFP
ncbi:hypothetical protein R3W88_014849 [Solanum pinnatisectum]|uniref:Uncharacterized protein n=1 Tax=Solanum pinnatisectum TaxID=50273 RepID=A0AAV9KT91_9SOLN|nr:hypothetical protein R3W88_014849 [Solanum pinnatisectum]